MECSQDYVYLCLQLLCLSFVFELAGNLKTYCFFFVCPYYKLSERYSKQRGIAATLYRQLLNHSVLNYEYS